MPKCVAGALCRWSPDAEAGAKSLCGLHWPTQPSPDASNSAEVESRWPTRARCEYWESQDECLRHLDPLMITLDIETASDVRESLGPTKEWSFLEPNRLLAHVIERSPQLAEAYGRAANESLPTKEDPWSLISP